MCHSTYCQLSVILICQDVTRKTRKQHPSRWKGFHTLIAHKQSCHTVRGIHVFCPLQQTHGAIMNTTFIGADDNVIVYQSGSTTAAAAVSAEAMGPPPLCTNNEQWQQNRHFTHDSNPLFFHSLSSNGRHSVVWDDTSSTTYNKQLCKSSNSGAARV